MPPLRIGELLVQEGLISPAQLQAALTAQQIFGGRLGTNLVEAGFVNEVDLARLLSRQLGIRMVQPHELSDVDPAVIALMPEKLARKYSVVPFAHDAESDRVSLAIADPNNLQKLDEIQFALGRRIDIFISPEVTLAWAMEKYYAVKPTRRFIRLAGATEAAFQMGQAERKVRPAGAPSHDEILGKIVDAQTKKELVSAVMNVLSRFAREVVFLAQRSDQLVAWESRGVAIEPDELRAATLSVETTPVLGEAVRTCAHRTWDGQGDAALSDLLHARLRLAPGPAFLLPLTVNQKAFGAFVLAGFEPRTFEAGVPLLAELMRRVSYKLQIFFLQEQLTAPL